MQNNFLSEMNRLHAFGFALHWLRPKSKLPVERGWSLGPRMDLKQLKMKYKDGQNLGVRLGSASIIAGKFLAVIDLDVKSTDARHQKEAVKKLLELMPAAKDAPVVASGRGNGSAHYYIRTTGLITTGATIAQSQDIVKVLMPSVKPSPREVETLSFEDIDAGYRLRAAWEIQILSEGRQCVLPPSIHPDTGAEYVWFTPCEAPESIPHVPMPAGVTENLPGQKKKKR